MNDPTDASHTSPIGVPDREQLLAVAVPETVPEGDGPGPHGDGLSSRSSRNTVRSFAVGLLRSATRLTAEPFTDDVSRESEVSSLPSSSAGLVIGLLMIATVSWTVAATLGSGADPTTAILLTVAALLILLIAPSTIRPGRGRGRAGIGAKAATVQYTAFAAASVLAWSSLLWLPGLTWAAMAVVAVLQTGYALGVALHALEDHLNEHAFDWNDEHPAGLRVDLTSEESLDSSDGTGDAVRLILRSKPLPSPPPDPRS